MIQISSLNIRSGQEGGLKAALQSLKQVNFGIRVLQETSLMEGIHMWYRARYRVRKMEAESRHMGSISTIFWEKARWDIEGETNYVPSMVSFMIT